MLLWQWSEKGIDIKLPFLDRQKIGIEKGNYQRKPIQILILLSVHENWRRKKIMFSYTLYYILGLFSYQKQKEDQS